MNGLLDLRVVYFCRSLMKRRFFRLIYNIEYTQ